MGSINPNFGKDYEKVPEVTPKKDEKKDEPTPETEKPAVEEDSK
jgi:hypothetical protein